MVYRGKISAGCINCRKSKKRCDLEQPACSRCVKLNKTCSGYRDTTQLQIEDESEAVIVRAQKKQVSLTLRERSNNVQYYPPKSTTKTEGLIFEAKYVEKPGGPKYGEFADLGLLSVGVGMVYSLTPHVTEIATNSFFGQFVTAGHWDYLQRYAEQMLAEPCLEYAIRACGMAAITNTRYVPNGREYASSMYAQALRLVNAALTDPKRCTRDESLLAVAMLSYYENITCENRQSIQSWKAHIHGATQLLKLRGKAQFKTAVGRMLFRETRSLILINAIWEEAKPPAFIWEWNDALDKADDEITEMGRHADQFAKLTYDYACIRHEIDQKRLTDSQAIQEIAEIDASLGDWAIKAIKQDSWWRYKEVDVPDSKHVWNGMVLEYEDDIGASVWDSYRVVRVMVTRSQELLCRKFPFSEAERQEQQAYFRRVRRQMADEICATVPCQLGHAAPARNSSSIIVTAYSSIWPLFFAGTCALERIDLKTADSTTERNTSAAAAQVAWIIGRMDYISDEVGLLWAQGFAAALRGDFRMHNDLKEAAPPQRSKSWLVEIETTHQGPKNFFETPDGQIAGRRSNGPIWLGRALGQNSNLG